MASWEDMRRWLANEMSGGPLSGALKQGAVGLWGALNEGAFGPLNRGLGAVMEDDEAWRQAHPMQAQARDAIDMMTMGGPGAMVGIFAGPKALTADLGALAKAKSLAKAGRDPEAVRAETGWFMGPDKNWRFEIDDSAAKFDRNALQFPQSGKLSDVLQHDELYRAYPHLRGAKLMSEPGRGGSTLGATSGAGADAPIFSLGTKAGDDVLLHEVQHGIQDFEGFEPGLSTAGAQSYFPDEIERTAHDLLSTSKRLQGASAEEQALSLQRALQDAGDELYMRSFGEVESRDVQARMFLSAPERALKPPYSSSEYPPEKWLFRKDNAKNARMFK